MAFEPADRIALSVVCGKCAHQWVAMYLPMELARAAKILKGLCCPSCGALNKHIRAAAERSLGK
jgi:hypothetical protein